MGTDGGLIVGKQSLFKYDITYCVRDDCPHSDCRRNRRNIPKGYVVSMADLQDLDGDNCRNYLKGDNRGKDR